MRRPITRAVLPVVGHSRSGWRRALAGSYGAQAPALASQVVLLAPSQARLAQGMATARAPSSTLKARSVKSLEESGRLGGKRRS